MRKKISEVIFDSMRDGVFTVDNKCRITSFNKSAERITGFTSAEAVGRYCFDIFRTEICHKRCALKDTLKTQESVENVHVNIITKDGCEKPICVTTRMLEDDSNEIIGAVEFFTDESEIDHLQKLLEMKGSITSIVSVNANMQKIIATLPNIAESGCNVLILGPSGAGKELFAEVIHNLSQRKYGPYIKINCAALPAQLLESELFGHEKGAFTDAKKDRPGQFCLANGGTLLLDEISEMDLALQVKLLRVLNNGEYRPLGSSKTLQSDARIIAATNANLQKLIEEGKFREDLYYRINVVEINVPSLKDRPEDIPVLASHFVNKYRKITNKAIQGVSPEALGILLKYPFPGNVRELENAIEHSFVMCNKPVIMPQHLPKSIINMAESIKTIIDVSSEKDLILNSLRRNKGNKSIAALELGMHRTTLWRKIRNYGIE